MDYPEMVLVRQRLHAQKIEDVRSAVRKAIKTLDLKKFSKPGESVAIGVGSRSISQISKIIYESVRSLQELGLKPFIVPAMGSHGGNTPEGEASVLASLGITESSMGVPIEAGTDVVEIGQLDVGIPILMDRHTTLANHIVVVNRVKPHTKFHGSIESGLTKILTIGLGKGQGASLYHRAAVQHSFAILQDAARDVLGNRSILFGLGIVEDGYKNVAKISAVRPNNWFETERSLLEDARSMMPRIPFDPIDVLVIDEIGKNISGIGMDSNVTGRHRDIVGDFLTAPHVKRIFVRDLSAGSHGNGNGIGLADVTTQRLVDAIDVERTYTNAITAISPEKAAIPIHFRTDRECLEACLNTVGMVKPEEVRMVRIKDTLTLDQLWASRALEGEITSNRDLSAASPWETLTFNDEENLEP
jgi:hypothetical protein